MDALPKLPHDTRELEALLDSGEANAHAERALKPGNAAGIVWAFPSDRQRTRLSVVYLHGFSASRGEAEQAIRFIASALGANVYFARLPGHGHVADDAQRGLSSTQLEAAARHALAVGQRLGDHVVLVGTSLGASLALWLAAEYPTVVDAVVAWSPGIAAPPDRDAQVRQLASGSAVLYPDVTPRPPEEAAHWSTCRHSDGYRAMVEFIDTRMRPETFARVTSPVFLGYYYRDDVHQDASAWVFAMRGMFGQLGTPFASKTEVAYPDGDHALAHPGRSRAAERVATDTIAFLQAQLVRRPRR